MAKAPKKDQADERSPEEAARLRDATLRRMLATKPKPHKDAKSKSK